MLLSVLNEDKHKYSSTQINIGGDLKKRILAYVKKIPKDILTDDGHELHPHITIKYGIHANSAAKIIAAVKDVKPFTVKLGKISSFKSPEFDVIKISVSGSSLHKLNKLISDKTKCTDTHPTYKPHLTIAYVKPGHASDYVGDDLFDGEEIEVSEFVFSDRDRDHTTIKLSQITEYRQRDVLWI